MYSGGDNSLVFKRPHELFLLLTLANVSGTEGPDLAEKKGLESVTFGSKTLQIPSGLWRGGRNLPK